MISAIEEMYGKDAEKNRKEREKKRIDEQKKLEEQRKKELEKQKENSTGTIEEEEIGKKEKELEEKEIIISELSKIVQNYWQIDPYILKMAYWLDFKSYCYYKKNNQDERFHSSVVFAPSFCHYDRRQSGDSVKHYNISWKSRLEQCYQREFYKTDIDTISYADNILLYDDKRKYKFICSLCSNNDSELQYLPDCPYFIAGTIQKLALLGDYSIKDIYRKLMGDFFVEFKSPGNIQIKEDLLNICKYIDTKTAMSAYILIQADLVSIDISNQFTIHYHSVLLCKKNGNFLTDKIINFWKKTEFETESFYYKNITEFFKSKRNCRNCGYRFCPDKVAAFFMVMAQYNNIEPIDFAYYVAKNKTGKLSLKSYFDYDESYSDVLRRYPFSSESAEIYQKLIRCIINHGSNRKIQISLSMIINVSDKRIADEIVSRIFNSACYVYDYFDNDRNNKIHVIDGIKNSLSETVASLKEAKKGDIYYIVNIEKWVEEDNFNMMFMLFCKIVEERKYIPIVIAGKKDTLQNFFETYPKMYYQICQHHITVKDMEVKPLFNNIMESLEEDFEIPYDTEQAIYQYIIDAYEESELKNYDFAEWFVEKIKFDHYSSDFNINNKLEVSEIPKLNGRRSVDEVINELFSMVGLDSVKFKVAEINAMLTFNQKSKKGNAEKPNLHMIFSGNAGTGKTTVAKLMAEILYNLGYIRKNKLVYCSAKDLEGAYLGQSAKNTAVKCESAYGGVLFIDEAYQLNPNKNGQFDRYKQDVIDELIQQMENNRSQFVVILAGYPEEMEDFINNANAGFESRIPNKIIFDDYTIDELMQIFNGFVDRSGLTLSKDVANVVQDIITEAKKNDTKNFSNARFVRNLFEKSYSHHARNVYHLEESNPEFYILTSEDIFL